MPPLLHIDRRHGQVTVRALGVAVLLLTDTTPAPPPLPPELDGPMEQLGEHLDQHSTGTRPGWWTRWLYARD